MSNPSPIQLIVYSVNDMDSAKKTFGAFLGTEPYVDEDYYVGYRVGDLEIGLDPSAAGQGFNAPIAYIDSDDIESSIKILVAAGAALVQEPTQVAPGLQVAKLKDADGNFLGLRQSSKE